MTSGSWVESRSGKWTWATASAIGGFANSRLGLTSSNSHGSFTRYLSPYAYIQDISGTNWLRGRSQLTQLYAGPLVISRHPRISTPGTIDFRRGEPRVRPPAPCARVRHACSNPVLALTLAHPAARSRFNASNRFRICSSVVSAASSSQPYVAQTARSSDACAFASQVGREL